jgi:hypothetical protein
MTNNEHSITDRERYNRFSEDWRFEHKLIWEIPSVTFAILGGLLTISYSFLGLLPRLIFLILGAVVVFGLTLAVHKHRFGADLRTSFLEDIGQDRERFPIRTEEAIKYLKEKKKEEEKKEGKIGTKSVTKRREKFSEFVTKRSSEKFLIWFMFLAFVSIFILILLTLWQILDEWIFLINEGLGVSQILNNITTK